MSLQACCRRFFFVFMTLSSELSPFAAFLVLTGRWLLAVRFALFFLLNLWVRVRFEECKEFLMKFLCEVSQNDFFDYGFTFICEFCFWVLFFLLQLWKTSPLVIVSIRISLFFFLWETDAFSRTSRLWGLILPLIVSRIQWSSNKSVILPFAIFHSKKLRVHCFLCGRLGNLYFAVRNI